MRALGNRKKTRIWKVSRTNLLTSGNGVIPLQDVILIKVFRGHAEIREGRQNVLKNAVFRCANTFSKLVPCPTYQHWHLSSSKMNCLKCLYGIPRLIFLECPRSAFWWTFQNSSRSQNNCKQRKGFWMLSRLHYESESKGKSLGF